MHVIPTGTQPHTSSAPAVLFGSIAAGTLLSGLLPIASVGDAKLFDAGVVYVLALVVPALLLVVVAASSSAKPDLVGLGGGVSLGVASLLGPMSAVLWKSTSGEGLGIGAFVITATSIAAIVGFIRSTSARTTGGRSSVLWIAFFAGFAMSLGATLVPPDLGGYEPSWAEYNYFRDGYDVVSALSFQFLVWAPCIALLVGAVRGGRFGALLSSGGALMLGWLIFAASADFGDESYLGAPSLSGRLHPLAGIAAVALGVLLVSALVTTTNSTTNSNSLAPASTMSGAVQSRWSADPFGRYESRFWDGSEWTEHVANGGVPSMDAPTWRPAAPPTPPVAPSTAQPPSAPLPQPTAAVLAAPALIERPLPSAEIDATIPRTPLVPASQASELVLDTGQRVVLVGPLVIGRAPRAQPAEPSATLLIVDDSTMSVSATHLMVGPAPGGAWVQDIGSTNGSSVVDASGATTELVPGVRAMAANGSFIHFGDRSARLVPSETN